MISYLKWYFVDRHIKRPIAWILTCDNPPQAHLSVMKTELEFITKSNGLTDYKIKPLYYGSNAND